LVLYFYSGAEFYYARYIVGFYFINLNATHRYAVKLRSAIPLKKKRSAVKIDNATT